MKHMRLMFCVTIVLMFLLAACVPASTPTPIIMVVTATAVPVTATSPGSTAPATAAPVILAGPQMQVGSTYLYFDGTLLVAVPGGPFLMGHGGSDNPEHTVTLSDFWIYSTKVTNAQYQQCVALGKCTAPDLNDNQTYTVYQRLNDPVVGVNWAQSEGILRICQWAPADGGTVGKDGARAKREHLSMGEQRTGHRSAELQQLYRAYDQRGQLSEGQELL